MAHLKKFKLTKTTLTNFKYYIETFKLLADFLGTPVNLRANNLKLCP